MTRMEDDLRAGSSQSLAIRQGEWKSPNELGIDREIEEINEVQVLNRSSAKFASPHFDEPSVKSSKIERR